MCLDYLIRGLLRYLLLLIDDGLLNFDVLFKVLLIRSYFDDFPVLPDWEGACFLVAFDDVDGCGLLYAELGNRIFERGRPPENELN